MLKNDGSLLALGLVAALAGVAAMKPKGSAKVSRKITGWTDDGAPIYATRKRPPRFAGRPVNPLVPLPKPPGAWVNDETCTACGAKYDEFVPGVDFRSAANALRMAAGGFESGGGYRSRGPVLHMMRVMKLEEWYREHAHFELEEQQYFKRKQQKQRRDRQQRQKRAMQVPLQKIPF